MKYLIALDMDGTLLKDDQTISRKTQECLINLSSKGHIVVISSGRPLRGIIKYYHQLLLNTPLICYNGGVIYPMDQDNMPLYERSFSKEEVISIINEIGLEYLDNVICESHQDIFLLHNDDSLDTFFTKKRMLVHIGNIDKILFEDCLMVCIKVKNPKYQEHVKNVVEAHPHLKLRFWSGEWLEISEIYFDDVNKGEALKYLANYLNIPWENIIAFGDACNDIEMLSFAKYGFAMKNAEEELKKIAYQVTEFDNEEDGIAEALNNLDFLNND